MLNPNEIPSLSNCLDRYLTAEVVSGKVENGDYRAYYTFSLATDLVANMTADELFLLYLKPVIENYIAPAINKLGSVCCKAMPLPGEGEKVVGFRSWRGKIPVNLYVMRRMNPDRHMYVLEAMVYPKRDKK